MKDYKLEKTIWTEADYEGMGWHDANIYGFVFHNDNADSATTDLIFDIDYIFKWVQPVPPKDNFSFWVAPCTLRFENTFALEIDIDRRGGLTDMFEVADLHLLSKSEEKENKWIYEWVIELQDGRIAFKATGFKQIVRQEPVLSDSQVLTLVQRNGISFSQTPF
ncbi:hypothetical protein [Sphingobacterium faecale]|uniref:Immunity protein 50 of polymorphic toxin system n=1 Tax=Sphingobacterium faecale TaxID=2803775 RepID=A0ABS1R9W2_9SPHI|nr:hypothetical protein [Sphingobacterium faecale]MBL1411085.1 hypothetical protein [Sphingobacterium faecale]